jgi:hypothetical protein
MEQRLCQLDFAAGRRKACPGDTCPFWVDDHCVVAPFWSEFGGSPNVAHLLTSIRTGLEERDPHRALRAMHPPGLV